MSSPTTPRVLRLALLVAGSPPPAVVAKYGDYPFLYRRILRKGLQAHHEDAALELSLRDYDVVHRQEYPTDAELMAGEIDGIVITGSAASAYEDKEWVRRLVAFTKRVYEEFPRVKMLGICFGHQIVGMAAGGTVEKNAKGWEITAFMCPSYSSPLPPISPEHPRSAPRSRSFPTAKLSPPRDDCATHARAGDALGERSGANGAGPPRVPGRVRGGVAANPDGQGDRNGGTFFTVAAHPVQGGCGRRMDCGEDDRVLERQVGWQVLRLSGRV
ncbi:hypothetical protein BC938DRAFT_476264 [Jimgerdemannia flammicorona]|uniref:Glutamine amidotransferase domain-containing protein n=1 Tax=Jimgerdemannia flammicorona TaxID=994334 RepID=A0A433QQQ2_9FUNG|nr:hypothetical protein BC938DRAFT_476264 [Jimgerdemannia flammicorona]